MNQTGQSAFIIKVCGITRIDDGQCAIEAGATALGFNFYQASPRYVTPRQAGDLIGQISGRYLRVGIFVNATSNDLTTIGSEAQLDVLQLHGTLPELLPHGFRIWRAITSEALPVSSSEFEAYLLDTPSAQFGGSGLTFDWSLAANFSGRSILAGGLHACNVAEAIAIARPAGVDACSKLEKLPGQKDPALVRSFVRAAVEANRLVVATNTKSEMIEAV